MSHSVAVVGGGITGLTAARTLARRGCEVVLYEASPRLGGRIRTTEMLGHRIEEGPDMFLARVPWAATLAREVGLGDDLIAPATGAAQVWRAGRSHPLPAELVLGAPSRVLPLARSGALSWPGKLRAALDVVLPRSRHGEDPSVGELIRPRFGDEVCDRLVDPLLGGINAGDADRLSAAASAPQLLEAARDRSLLRGLRRQRAKSSLQGDQPVFWSVQGGLDRFPAAVADEARAAGAELRTDSPVDQLEQAAGGGVVLTVADEERAHDGVVLATAASITARLVSPLSPAAADHLSGVAHASVSVLVAVVDDDALGAPADVSGLLVPKVDGRLITAISFGSVKWPQWKPEGATVMRISAGRVGDERHLDLDDADFERAILAETDQLIGVTAPPRATRVIRWQQAFPQYEPGHAARIAAARTELVEVAPTVETAGASFDGLGIPACVRQADTAVDRLLARMEA